jgi:NAD/NADP transhydrogenase alpha subunit
MYSKNITTFLGHLVKGDAIAFELGDEITRETLVTHQGDVAQARVRDLLTVAR